MEKEPPASTDEETADDAGRLPTDAPETHYEDPIDDAADDSFPASDPPSFTDATATRNPRR